ncbi:MAG: hypothetical protein K2W99_08440, partial [Chthoniobacterales bacterium]|nr:hypothetical protein [Chthoniobacterales bacterium]
MKNLYLLLLLSWFMLGPLPVSAMMDPDKKEAHEELDNPEKNLKKNTEEKCLEAEKAAAERVNNPGADNNTETKVEAFFEQKGSYLNEEEKISPTREGAEAFNGGDNGEEEEDLSDLSTLEQRIQEAQKVIDDFREKGTPILEQELGNLYQTWSERYQRYQEAQSSLLKNNNLESIEEEQNQPNLKKLGELVGISQEVITILEEAKKTLATFSNTKRIEKFSYLNQNQQSTDMNITKPSLSGTPYHYVTENENNTTAA